MKNIFPYLLSFSGTIWFFQGINVLPGSFMTGDPFWAVAGGAAALVGAYLLWARRRAG